MATFIHLFIWFFLAMLVAYIQDLNSPEQGAKPTVDTSLTHQTAEDIHKLATLLSLYFFFFFFF